ncbi:hypothetical protein KZZ08_17145 [Roseovarius mucosus]|uniref:Uncharacterized protein n=1 Tax=Roseovarius mucosus TaxID=215743 RepID=A0A1V0RTF9_9RHOB|nr:hypothetical protein [Roseovarius mucosus]ARE84935.1 hypothetical protein ROSMUCSMR3_03481 [Roseovarius mucosus]MBW4975360.1 hypothetical protein [Roseovarius mucosus]
MQITLSPTRRDTPLTLSRTGDALTLNGEVLDFTPLPEGATLPREAIASDWFAGPVERVGGTLRLTLVLPHGANAPQETLFPAPLTLTGNGPVTLPPYELETPDAD